MTRQLHDNAAPAPQPCSAAGQTVDAFDDIRVLRYDVPGFDQLPLPQKQLIYYLSEAALCGRDILYDQNCRYNLVVRRTLEAVYRAGTADPQTAEWLGFEKYLKKVWFANGIHHHYAGDKFVPEFSEAWFDARLAALPDEVLPLDFGSRAQVTAIVRRVLFDPAFCAVRECRTAGEDLLTGSAMNYYDGVTQAEAEAFYRRMTDADDPEPVSVGLNSRLVKRTDGTLEERVWKIGGLYSPALERIVEWLERAAAVASPIQREVIDTLIDFYRTGNLKSYDRFSIRWVRDTESAVDFVNGFTETYGDPLGYKASWEALVDFRDEEATRRTETVSAQAQWFEDHSPVQEKYKKKKVCGVSAKVINAAMLGGDNYPATPIGINLPNADWIRKTYGSKSVTIQNITRAYAENAKGNGFLEEFILRAEDRERIARYGTLADNLHTDLHECLGHGSGQLAPGVRGDELKQYGSVLEEARADLFGLYYAADPKLIELGLVPDADVARAEYASYISNGLFTQLARIAPGKQIEQAHMRNRQLIGRWACDLGAAGRVIEQVVEEEKTYFVVNDFDALRAIFGRMLREVQRIKSEGDFVAGRDLVERYGIRVDPALHAEVLERYARLGIRPYAGFVNPTYTPVTDASGAIVDIRCTTQAGYAEQMLAYSDRYSFLPTDNNR